MLAKDDTITEGSLPPELMLPAELRDEIAIFPPPSGGGTAPVPGSLEAAGDSLNLDDRERRAILQALAQTHGNKLKAAKMLGIHRPTLYNKMKRYGIGA